MTEAEYKSVTEKDMKKKRWRLNTRVSSSVVTLAAGTEVLLQFKRSGFNIATGCDHCGMRATIRKVPFAFIDQVV